jgi:RNA polymerase sigma-70 factor (ECF subfamily)
VVRHHQDLYGFCLRHTGTRSAEDVVQQAFMALAGGSFDPARGTFKAWLYGVALNIIRKDARSQNSRQKREKAAHMENERVRQETDTLEKLTNQEMQSLTKKAFNNLPDNMRTILDLHVLQGLSCEELGRMMGVSHATIHRRVVEAKK